MQKKRMKMGVGFNLIIYMYVYIFIIARITPFATITFLSFRTILWIVIEGLVLRFMILQCVLKWNNSCRNVNGYIETTYQLKVLIDYNQFFKCLRIQWIELPVWGSSLRICIHSCTNVLVLEKVWEMYPILILMQLIGLYLVSLFW